MSKTKKIGRNLIVLGILMMIAAVPNFIIANNKHEKAEVERKINEVRADAQESSANFNKTMAYVLIAGGALSVVIGCIAKSKKS